MKMSKRYVLVETRFLGTEITNDWYPDFVSRVYGETINRVGVKRHWWSAIRWVPRNGPLAQVKEITVTP